MSGDINLVFGVLARDLPVVITRQGIARHLAVLEAARMAGIA